jgi:hypothetical protein
VALSGSIQSRSREGEVMSNDQDNHVAPALDYEVGNCRPPKHSQFKKGASGNLKGRPKGSINLRTRITSYAGIWVMTA